MHRTAADVERIERERPDFSIGPFAVVRWEGERLVDATDWYAIGKGRDVRIPAPMAPEPAVLAPMSRRERVGMMLQHFTPHAIATPTGLRVVLYLPAGEKLTERDLRAVAAALPGRVLWSGQ
jgi:hypothetical protein